MSTQPQTESLVPEVTPTVSHPEAVSAAETMPAKEVLDAGVPCWTPCGDLAADRLRTESALEAQARADRLRELEALRERAKLD